MRTRSSRSTRLKIAAVVAALTTALAACGSGGGGGGASSDGPIVIGGILDETGAAADYGTAALHGAQVAFDQVNAAGGIGGRKIELRQSDGGFDVAQSTGILQRYASDRDVVAIVGPNSDSVSIPLTERINRSEIVAIQTSGATQRPSEDYGDWLFSVPVSNRVLIDRVASELSARGLQRVAVVFSTSRAFAVAARDDFVAAAGSKGLTLVGEPIGYNDSDVDFSTVVTTLRSMAPLDAVFCSCLPPAAGPMIAQATDSGLNVQWVSDASLLSPSFFELSRGRADGTLLATPFAPIRDNEVVQKFVADFRAAHGKDPDLYAAYGYDSAMALVRALESVDGEITRESVRAALASVNFEGATGRVSFPDGSGVATRAEVFLVEMRDGSFVSVGA